MSTTVSILEPLFDEPREHPGFTCRRARLGRQAGSEKLGLSLWELPPGQAAYPYHFHLAEEDIVVRPDSDSLSVFERRPQGGGPAEHFRLEDAVGYLDCFEDREEGS